MNNAAAETAAGVQSTEDVTALISWIEGGSMVPLGNDELGLQACLGLRVEESTTVNGRGQAQIPQGRLLRKFEPRAEKVSNRTPRNDLSVWMVYSRT